MRKVFLDDLPRKEGFGANKGKSVMDWKSSIGYKITFIYNNINGEIEILDYQTKDQYLTVKYADKEFRIKSGGFYDCKIGSLLNEHSKEFKIEIGAHFKDYKRDLEITDREYRERKHKPDKKNRIYIESQKWYKFCCNQCSWKDGWIEESKLINNGGCSCCHGKTVVHGINDIATTDPELLEYLLNKEDGKSYSKYSEQKILVKCKDCEKTKYVVVSDLYSNKSIGCCCGDGFSMGHKYMHELFFQLNLDFIDNYKPKWCKYYNEYKNKNSYGEYDFFIEDLNLIIEVDGDFHRKDNKMNKQTKEESKYIDDMKDNLAKENGYEVIRIAYEEGDFRENIFNSRLSSIFDLSEIDWVQCEKFALKNIVKEVCEIWRDRKKSEATSDIAKIFGISNKTVYSYIKRGAKFGWCEYNAEEENRKNNLRTKERNKHRCSKKVEVFKDGESKGVFESITYLSNKSEELFGVRFNIGNISNLCRGKGIQSKGYTFKYVV